MASTRRPNISVEPRPDGRWAVQKDGTQRASKLFDTQSAAIDRARRQASREHTELLVKDQAGRVRLKQSHGHDPRSTPG